MYISLTARQIAEILKGSVEGNAEVVINRPAKIEEGGEGAITFLANPKYEAFIYKVEVSAILVSEDFVPQFPIQATLIKVKDVYSSIGILLNKIEEIQAVSLAEGVSQQAIISPNASLEADVHVAPLAVIEEGVSLGEGSRVGANAFIGANAKIGKNVKIHQGVYIGHHCEVADNCVIQPNAVIGGDGFGFAPQADGTYSKIAQIGKVLLEENVEIGANTTIDRATMGATIIRKGAKIDNLVQIAHNVEIGENTVIAAQAGVAGSTKIGKNCMIGGQVGFAGHLKIADGTKIQAQSGIGSHIKKENQALFGSPALPYNHYIKSYAMFKQLPEMAKELKRLRRELDALKPSQNS